MAIPGWTDCGYDDETGEVTGHTYGDGDVIVGVFDRRGETHTMVVRFVIFGSGNAYVDADGESLGVNYTLTKWRDATPAEIREFEKGGPSWMDIC